MIYDSVVVGGGPSGSMASYYLAKNGYNVLLLERQKMPRPKACGGSISLRIVKEIPFNISDVLLTEIKSVRFLSPNLKHEAVFKSDTPIAYTTLREKFDIKLLEESRKAGTVVREGVMVKKIKEERNGVKVYLSDGSFVESKTVIGADGVGSVVAKDSRIRKSIGKNQMGIALNTFLEKKGEDNTAEFYFGPDNISKLGYAWSFPVGNFYNVGMGIISERPVNLKGAFSSFVKKHKKSDYGVLYSAPVPFIGFNPQTKPYTKRIVLVGDAAGFLNKISGEGIYHAVVSGRLAAESISQFIENPRSENHFDVYLKECMNMFGHEVLDGDSVHKLVGSISTGYYKLNYMVKMLKKDEKLLNLMVDLYYALDDTRKTIKYINRRKWLSFIKALI